MILFLISQRSFAIVHNKKLLKLLGCIYIVITSRCWFCTKYFSTCFSRYFGSRAMLSRNARRVSPTLIDWIKLLPLPWFNSAVKLNNIMRSKRVFWGFMNGSILCSTLDMLPVETLLQDLMTCLIENFLTSFQVGDTYILQAGHEHGVTDVWVEASQLREANGNI